ncbi:MAG: YqgE/AlgH family protein [Gammaproteobacteria bacterium]|jgi:putative transcriptional regulator
MQSLRNHFLIAMPNLEDPNFNESVTYVCQHDEHGAVGIMVNRPGHFTFADIFERLGIECDDNERAQALVLTGGPVEPERGFVLHDASREFESTIDVGADVFLTASRDVLEAIADGSGPQRALLALGYAGWGAGQLEAEIVANSWLSVEATRQVLFDTPYAERWTAAADLIGIDIRGISTYTGHA